MAVQKLQWQPTESEELRAEILHAVRFAAERLKAADPGDNPNTFLGSGVAGPCLLFGQLDRMFPEEGWDLVGHKYLVTIQQRLQTHGAPNLSLWSGLGGTLLAVKALSRGGQRYQNMLQSLLGSLIGTLQKQMPEKRQAMANDLVMTDYDTIGGMAGVGRILLAFADRDDAQQALRDVLDYLIELCGDKEAHGLLVPTWLIHSHNHYREDEQEMFANGSLNLGLSHGITGPLALMSLALLQGIEVPGQREAMRRAADFVRRFQGLHDEEPLWPGRISFETWQTGELPPLSPRDSWCYGAPGIGRALWLAGAALEDAALTEAGIAAYRGIAKREDSKRSMNTPTICHGWGGLMHIVQRMHADTALPELLPCRDELARLVLSTFSEAHPYGFEEFEARQPITDPGLLEGASGVILTLLSLVTEEAPDWDAVLMIS
ncbi:lanthionine synthetase-like protein [Tumebacillus sp. BK434]|uniref:lanthionine synthetase C family protein n=1 Tax=Tumebacillus sp. BK434 TaxID=2512169 RepID=UPI0010498B48|nr:lanthionine synthetase C family protein [Tumebacillus sp. BK434]TCP54490.1 lanthionine synthetase-like protein [Tumebacillus sp. BK434]